MKFELVIVGSLETNCYLVYCPQTLECAVVDPGAEPHKIIHLIIHNKLKPVIILNTHGHVDHIGANQNIKEKYNIPLAIHIHTPGHSPGSVSFLGDGFILSGDTLFCGGVGRTDLPGGSWQELEQSIKNKILVLPEETIVLPGHGPSTSVRQEKKSNPFIP